MTTNEITLIGRGGKALMVVIGGGRIIEAYTYADNTHNFPTVKWRKGSNPLFRHATDPVEAAHQADLLGYQTADPQEAADIDYALLAEWANEEKGKARP